MKEIKLAGGYIALVDDDDFDLINQHKWHSILHHNTRYACRGEKIDGKYKQVRMHRAIVGTPKEGVIDHINNNGLDNRRENLRICTHSQNCMNRKMMGNFSSKYKGVIKRGRKFTAQIKIIGKSNIKLGSFKSEIDAARAYDKKALEQYGEYANINFPIEIDEKQIKRE